MEGPSIEPGRDGHRGWSTTFISSGMETSFQVTKSLAPPFAQSALDTCVCRAPTLASRVPRDALCTQKSWRMASESLFKVQGEYTPLFAHFTVHMREQS